MAGRLTINSKGLNRTILSRAPVPFPERANALEPKNSLETDVYSIVDVESLQRAETAAIKRAESAEAALERSQAALKQALELTSQSLHTGSPRQTAAASSSPSEEVEALRRQVQLLEARLGQAEAKSMHLEALQKYSAPPPMPYPMMPQYAYPPPPYAYPPPQ